MVLQWFRIWLSLNIYGGGSILGPPPLCLFQPTSQVLSALILEPPEPLLSSPLSLNLLRPSWTLTVTPILASQIQISLSLFSLLSKSSTFHTSTQWQRSDHVPILESFTSSLSLPFTTIGDVYVSTSLSPFPNNVATYVRTHKIAQGCELHSSRGTHFIDYTTNHVTWNHAVPTLPNCSQCPKTTDTSYPFPSMYFSLIFPLFLSYTYSKL